MEAEKPTGAPIAEIRPHLARRVERELGQNVYLCYQCIKCTSGCPMGEFFDWQPNQILRALQLGEEEIALHSLTPWLCAACQTCSTRCPQGLDISAIMEFLTREALAQGIEPKAPEVAIFNRAFLRQIRLWGRLYEPGLMIEMKLANLRSLFDEFDLYARMLRKRKVSFFPRIVRPPRKPRPRGGAAQAIAYYPGCSLHSSAKEFDDSARAVCKALGLELVEPEGWVCCGSSAAHRADPETAFKLPMQNLRLFEQSGFSEVTMPCAACYSRHQAARYEMRHSPQRRRAIEEAMEYSFRDSVRITTLLEAISVHAGEREVARRTQRPLKGLRVACYYGCLITRPPHVTGAVHVENPTEMETLLAAGGAEVVDWSYKTTCCGAAHSLTRPQIVRSLSSKLLIEAQKAGADVLAVACPLCHTNLDARQFQMALETPLPVLYFTQLLGIALAIPLSQIGLERNLTDPFSLLRSKNLL
ncbi:MAG: heterodisulfide reductase-related iron-sulfur binding cluster [Anaerolineales bacterium]|nr:heterodisulfide reductase-related iron-sulfur binding cluster [Anaerolineales bacterium]MCS7248224.1 heterodisulfide reductase-related iron-sulfur binding cluster [Anaerolineales bacterium]MDW8162037.1 heterodisulfide reductase-related iron-sulfur binding cluster [Anaerolineales bacterium]MDW8445662.1 heterodisulfide reductase-related iron-sulfur binding cluster [Anaerolineales bacterium]